MLFCIFTGEMGSEVMALLAWKYEIGDFKGTRRPYLHYTWEFCSLFGRIRSVGSVSPGNSREIGK